MHAWPHRQQGAIGADRAQAGDGLLLLQIVGTLLHKQAAACARARRHPGAVHESSVMAVCTAGGPRRADALVS